MQEQTDEGREAALRAAGHARAAATSAGLAAREAAEALGVVAEVARVVGAERGREVVSVVRERAADLPTPAALEGVIEEALDRGVDVWDALRGRPRTSRRWPWYLGTALAGALVAAGGALAARRLSTTDAPGAQEPEQLRAVVDLDAPPVQAVPPVPAATAEGPVDEDGETVLPSSPGTGA